MEEEHIVIADGTVIKNNSKVNYSNVTQGVYIESYSADEAKKLIAGLVHEGLLKELTEGGDLIQYQNRLSLIGKNCELDGANVNINLERKGFVIKLISDKQSSSPKTSAEICELAFNKLNELIEDNKKHLYKLECCVLQSRILRQPRQQDKKTKSQMTDVNKNMTLILLDFVAECNKTLMDGDKGKLKTNAAFFKKQLHKKLSKIRINLFNLQSDNKNNVSNKTNKKLRKITKHILDVGISLLNGAPEGKWVFALLGDLAKGIATPFSHISYIVLIDKPGLNHDGTINNDTQNYFQMHTKLVQMIMICLGQTALTRVQSKHIDELKTYAHLNQFTGIRLIDDAQIRVASLGMPTNEMLLDMDKEERPYTDLFFPKFILGSGNSKDHELLIIFWKKSIKQLKADDMIELLDSAWVDNREDMVLAHEIVMKWINDGDDVLNNIDYKEFIEPYKTHLDKLMRYVVSMFYHHYLLRVAKFEFARVPKVPLTELIDVIDVMINFCNEAAAEKFYQLCKKYISEQIELITTEQCSVNMSQVNLLDVMKKWYRNLDATVEEKWRKKLFDSYLDEMSQILKSDKNIYTVVKEKCKPSISHSPIKRMTPRKSSPRGKQLENKRRSRSFSIKDSLRQTFIQHNNYSLKDESITYMTTILHLAKKAGFNDSAAENFSEIVANKPPKIILEKLFFYLFHPKEFNKRDKKLLTLLNNEVKLGAVHELYFSFRTKYSDEGIVSGELSADTTDEDRERNINSSSSENDGTPSTKEQMESVKIDISVYGNAKKSNFFLDLLTTKSELTLGEENHKLPIGRTNFVEIRQDGYTYIDKTSFIKELNDVGDQILLFLRPPRYGKSTELSMLRSYYGYAEHRPFFKNLEVWEDQALMEKQGQYIVLDMDLKQIISDNEKTFFSNFKVMVSELYQEVFGQLYDKKIVKAKLELSVDMNQILQKNVTRSQLEWSLYYLLSLVKRKIKQAGSDNKVIVLIDEFDSALVRAKATGNSAFYKEILRFLKGFLHKPLKNSKGLFQRAIITSITQLKGDAIFSQDMNNVSVFSLLENQFSDAFGFTDNELKLLLRNYNCSDQFEKLKEYYGQYYCGKICLTHPWSVMKAISSLNQGKIEYTNYWANENNGELIVTLIKNANNDILMNLLDLFYPPYYVVSTINAEVSVTFTNKTSDLTSLASILLASGFATIIPFEEKTETRLVILPNREVLNFLENQLNKRGIKTTYSTYVPRSKIINGLVGERENDEIPTIAKNLFKVFLNNDNYKMELELLFVCGFFADNKIPIRMLDEMYSIRARKNFITEVVRHSGAFALITVPPQTEQFIQLNSHFRDELFSLYNRKRAPKKQTTIDFLLTYYGSKFKFQRYDINTYDPSDQYSQHVHKLLDHIDEFEENSLLPDILLSLNYRFANYSLYRKINFELVFTHFKRCEKLARVLTDPNYSIWQIKIFGRLGKASLRLAEFEEAEKYFSESDNLILDVAGIPPMIKARNYLQYARLKYTRGERGEAIKNYELAIENYNYIDNNSIFKLFAEIQICWLKWQHYEKNLICKMANQIVDACKKDTKLTESNPIALYAYLAIAYVNKESNLPETINKINKITDLTRKLYGEDHLEYAKVLIHQLDLGTLDRQKCETVKQQAEKILDETFKNHNQAVYYLSLWLASASAYLKYGYISLALTSYKKADQVFKITYGTDDLLSKNPYRYIEFLCGQARLHFIRGDYQASLKLCNDIIATDVKKRVQYSDKDSLSEAYQIKGDLLMKLGRPDQAQLNYKYATNAIGDAYPPEHIRILRLNQCKANAEILNGRVVCIRYCDIFIKNMAESDELFDPLLTVEVYINYANMQLKLGDISRAINTFDQGVFLFCDNKADTRPREKLREHIKSIYTGHPLLARILSNAALALALDNKIKDAIVYILLAQEIYNTAHLWNSYPAYAQHLYNMAYIRYFSGNLLQHVLSISVEENEDLKTGGIFDIPMNSLLDRCEKIIKTLSVTNENSQFYKEFEMKIHFLRVRQSLIGYDPKLSISYDKQSALETILTKYKIVAPENSISTYSKMGKIVAQFHLSRLFYNLGESKKVDADEAFKAFFNSSFYQRIDFNNIIKSMNEHCPYGIIKFSELKKFITEKAPKGIQRLPDQSVITVIIESLSSKIKNLNSIGTLQNKKLIRQLVRLYSLKSIIQKLYLEDNDAKESLHGCEISLYKLYPYQKNASDCIISVYYNWLSFYLATDPDTTVDLYDSTMLEFKSLEKVYVNDEKGKVWLKELITSCEHNLACIHMSRAFHLQQICEKAGAKISLDIAVNIFKNYSPDESTNILNGISAELANLYFINKKYNKLKKLLFSNNKLKKLPENSDLIYSDEDYFLVPDCINKVIEVQHHVVIDASVMIMIIAFHYLLEQPHRRLNGTTYDLRCHIQAFKQLIETQSLKSELTDYCLAHCLFQAQNVTMAEKLINPYTDNYEEGNNTRLSASSRKPSTITQLMLKLKNTKRSSAAEWSPHQKRGSTWRKQFSNKQKRIHSESSGDIKNPFNEKEKIEIQTKLESALEKSVLQKYTYTMQSRIHKTCLVIRINVGFNDRITEIIDLYVELRAILLTLFPKDFDYIYIQGKLLHIHVISSLKAAFYRNALIHPDILPPVDPIRISGSTGKLSRRVNNNNEKNYTDEDNKGSRKLNNPNARRKLAVETFGDESKKDFSDESEDDNNNNNNENENENGDDTKQVGSLRPFTIRNNI